MKKFAALMAIGLFSLAAQVFAHGDHDHEHAAITEAEAVSLTQKIATRLTKTDAGLEMGKLPASWANLPAEKIKIHKKGNGYYIMSASNGAEAKTLYVLMSTEGEIFDANLSGQFKNLDK